mmetsp:Transcript_30648/g.100055  ORF Transcript_30648/g.100055 Transcript_30648/m.100055 type:complete len:254 (-) Transcript_30648:356-1117(-)
MPTCPSTPSASSAARSSAVVTPPATVSWPSPPSASTSSRTASRSMPCMRPSRSTNVTRKLAAYGFSSRILSTTLAPVRVVHPSTTTSPCRASSATTTRSRGSCRSTSGRAAVPSTTLAAPAWSQSRALSALRMPPPTRQGAILTSFLISSSLEPRPSAASKSTTAISPTRLNLCANGTGSPASTLSASMSPPTSCTAWPPRMSIDGTRHCTLRGDHDGAGRGTSRSSAGATRTLPSDAADVSVGVAGAAAAAA